MVGSGCLNPKRDHVHSGPNPVCGVLQGGKQGTAQLFVHDVQRRVPNQDAHRHWTPSPLLAQFTRCRGRLSSVFHQVRLTEGTCERVGRSMCSFDSSLVPARERAGLSTACSLLMRKLPTALNARHNDVSCSDGSVPLPTNNTGAGYIAPAIAPMEHGKWNRVNPHL